MSYQKAKVEEYKNIGGINHKASVYVTGEKEVLDLVNYDFSTPGAWTKRWGMTNALSGNTLTVGASQRFLFGFQTYLSYVDNATATFSQKSYFVGSSAVYSYTGGALAVSSSMAPTVGFGNAVVVSSRLYETDLPTFSSNAYFTSNNIAFKAKYDSIYYYGLPMYNNGIVGVALATFASSGTGGATGTYNFAFAYKDVFGYVGPAGETRSYTVTAGSSNVIISGFTFTTKSILSGATCVSVFADRVFGYPSTEMREVGKLPIGSATLTITVGLTLGQFVESGSYDLPLTVPNDSSGPYARDFGFYVSDANCVELYSSRLFFGLSTGKNIIYYSEAIEFQNNSQIVYPESFLLVKSGGFPLIGLKAYNQSLICLFQKGVVRITGDNSENFNAIEISNEYGLVGQRAMCVFEERLWFLDNNHIVQFNGSNLSIVSHRIDHIIARMNVSAAQKTATAYHYEERHEVWFAIPIDGSEENNIILVYDYLADSWTTFKSSSNFTMLQEVFDQTWVQGATTSTVFLNNKKLFTAHPGGSMGYFGASFATDYGNSITLSFKTRYHAEQGHSVTSEWRRLYLDTGPWASVTLAFQANFYANFATATIHLTRSIYASGLEYSGKQQSRIDFGIPAKSLSAEVVYGSTASVRVYGYTVESRFLRNV